MSNKLEEYFDRNTDDAKKRQISSNTSVDEEILIKLGDSLRTDNEVQAFKTKLDAVIKQKKRRQWIYLKIAASIVLILSLGFLIININDELDQNDLFQAYYKPYDGYSVPRGGNDLWSDGILLYENRAFADAIELFNQAIIENPNDSKLMLILGSCYLSTNQVKQAEQILMKIEDSNELIVSNKKWYLALTYLKQNKIDRSKKLLVELVETSPSYAKKAAILLEEVIYQ
ncbi:tetratricopeptide repeat protein [Ekhidna sp.]|uniref:tetratricopeptide repeat protein n=1 Tax=Ekhidna sp. TaxID=2608089 RepID=UPI003299CE60